MVVPVSQPRRGDHASFRHGCNLKDPSDEFFDSARVDLDASTATTLTKPPISLSKTPLAWLAHAVLLSTAESFDRREWAR
ncbi:MAG TPA: hypothetical protein VFR79_15895 [Nitrospira sp.]|nr:hypothetical protein [Nitrospira sp.]